jgi:hypothetical protein
MTELSMLELQAAELLPVREALQGFNYADVTAINLALALPEQDGDALAAAHQTVVVLQSAGD